MKGGESVFNIRQQRSIRMLTACLSLIGIGTAALRAEETAKSAAPGMAPVAPISWKDVSGHTFDLTQVAASKATVFVFTSTQCPISNIYTPRINALVKDFTARGVRFFLVDSNREDTAST